MMKPTRHLGCSWLSSSTAYCLITYTLSPSLTTLLSSCYRDGIVDPVLCLVVVGFVILYYYYLTPSTPPSRDPFLPVALSVLLQPAICNQTNQIFNLASNLNLFLTFISFVQTARSGLFITRTILTTPNLDAGLKYFVLKVKF